MYDAEKKKASSATSRPGDCTERLPDSHVHIHHKRMKSEASTPVVRCRICACSEREPCEPPCAWFETDLCSNCALILEALISWGEAAHRANTAALMREFKRYFEIEKAKAML